MSLIKSKFGLWAKQGGNWRESEEHDGRTRKVKLGFVWLNTRNQIIAGPYLNESGLKKAEGKAKAISLSSFVSRLRIDSEAWIAFMKDYPIKYVAFNRHMLLFKLDGMTAEFCIYRYNSFMDHVGVMEMAKPLTFRRVNSEEIVFSNGKKIKFYKTGYMATPQWNEIRRY